MLTLDVRPSKRLLLIYSLIYILTLSLIIVCTKTSPVFIVAMILASLLTAGIAQLYQLFQRKMLYCLPRGDIKLEFKSFSATYDKITICHQGPRLIVLSCKNNWQHRYMVCMSDSFSQHDFSALQRFLKHREWTK